MTAEKARLFGDGDTLRVILAAPDPDRAKGLGRRVASFDAAIWDAQKFDIVVAGSLHKFAQNADLKAFLRSTGSKVLVEASPVDLIWGIGLQQDDPRASQPEEWPGENLLGFALMKAR